MTDTLLDLLAKSPFGSAGSAVVQWLAPLFVSHHVDKGAVIFVEGEREGRFFVIGEGRVKAFRHLPSGRSVTIFNLVSGDFFGFIPLLDGGPFPVSVSAVVPSELFVLSREDFLRALGEHPELCELLLAYTAHRLRGCFDQVGQLCRRGAVTRAAHALLSLVATGTKYAGGAEVVLPSSQSELAQSIDVTPENLSRALARLCREGAIERTGPRRFRILDIELLTRRAESPEPED